MNENNSPKSARKWLLTINNPVEKGYTHERIKEILCTVKLDYYCFSDEIGLQTETYHTHIFLRRETSGIPFEQIKKLFPEAHIDKCLGSSQENRDYVKKVGKWEDTTKNDTSVPGTFEEFGEFKEEYQGKRTDLSFMYDSIKDGCSTFEILEKNPSVIRHMDKIDGIRQMLLFEQFKNTFRVLDVTYQFGPPGTGKSRYVMDKYGFQNVFRVTDWLHPWDTYRGQDVVLMEEFFESAKITDMLNWLDGYPLDLPCRYNNKTACFTKVYINSNKPLESQYQSIQTRYRDTWLAFLRRIHHIRQYDLVGNVTQFDDMKSYLTKWSEVNEKDVPFNSPDNKKNVSNRVLENVPDVSQLSLPL